jgi:hypothetical protein
MLHLMLEVNIFLVGCRAGIRKEKGYGFRSFIPSRVSLTV